MFVEIRNPSAVELLNYRVTHFENSPERVLMRFSMEAREGGLMEWMVHEVRPRYNTADWTRGPKPAEDTVLELELRPVRRIIGERDYSGFSYRYHYQERRDSHLQDSRPRELGDRGKRPRATSSGCGIASCRPSRESNPRRNFTRPNGIFPDCANPSAFQFIPLQTELQGFSFTASPAGVLVTWASEVAHIRSLFEKPRGEDVMTHFHEHCGDLGHEFSTAPVEVLWSPGQRSRGGPRERLRSGARTRP